MMTRTHAEQAVRWLLDGIHGIEHLDILMPYQFEVTSIDAEARENPFAPSLRHWQVTASVDVPVIWTPVNGRATLPATRDNLDEFRKLVDTYTRYAPPPVRLLEPTDWAITPDEHSVIPARGEPDPDWTVAITFRVH